MRFENVQAHGAAGGIVKNQAEKIELQDGVEAIGKLVEEQLEIALLAIVSLTSRRASNCRTGCSRAEEGAISADGSDSFAMKRRIPSGSAGSQPKVGCAGTVRFSYTFEALDRRFFLFGREW